MKKLLLPLLMLAGCAGPALVPGQSTLVEVERSLGRAADKRPGAGGETVYWYPQLPWGYASYAARMGADGKLVAVEQRLTTENTDKLKVGATRIEEVRDLLGPPFEPMKRPTDGHEIYTYPMRVTGDPTPKWFLAQFSAQGVLVEKYTINDPNWDQRGFLTRP
jgi:hypothetical protein